jgi:hypothetical protein
MNDRNNEPAMTVTSLNPSPRRRAALKTIEHRTFESTIPENQEAINLVGELRSAIEEKEAEIYRLREALQRDDFVDLTKIPGKLRDLQTAFDQIQKICADRIRPVEFQFHDILSVLAGRQFYMKTMTDAVSERAAFARALERCIEGTTADLHDPMVHEVWESCVRDFYQSDGVIESDIDRFRRAISIDKFAEKQLLKMNELLQRQFSDAEMREQKSHRKMLTARKDLDVRCSIKSKQTLDENYFRLRKNMEKLTLDVNREKNYNAMLRRDTNDITDSNRSLVEEIAQMTEEYIQLQMNLPDETNERVSKPDSLRNHLQIAEVERDTLQLQVLVAKSKLKIHQQKLSAVEEKLAQAPDILAESEEQLQNVQAQREAAERALVKMQTDESERMSQRVFLLDQKKLLMERITEHRARLLKLRKRQAKLELIYRRQLLVRDFNARRSDLENCNLQHTAGVISAMLEIREEMGAEIKASSSSSSGGH